MTTTNSQFRQFTDSLKAPGYLSQLDIMRIRKAAEGNTDEDFREFFSCDKASALRIIGFWEVAKVELWNAEIIKRFFHVWIYEDRDMVAARIHAAQLNGRLPAHCTPEIGLRWLESENVLMGMIPQWVRANVVRQPDATMPAAKTEAVPDPSGEDWQTKARAIADECFDQDTASNCRDTLKNYSKRVMEAMQKRKIKGPRGTIDNANYVMREALQGKKWWANKSK